MFLLDTSTESTDFSVYSLYKLKRLLSLLFFVGDKIEQFSDFSAIAAGSS